MSLFFDTHMKVQQLKNIRFECLHENRVCGVQQFSGRSNIEIGLIWTNRVNETLSIFTYILIYVCGKIMDTEIPIQIEMKI